MFDKPDSDRLAVWHDFRNSLETSDNPLQDVIDFYNKAPLVSIVMDPYDQESWLDPWELMYENNYCEFAIVLGIYHTLSLTDRFSQVQKEIHICTNKEVAKTKYLLYIGDNVIGFDRQKVISKNDLDANWIAETVYQLPILQ